MPNRNYESGYRYERVIVKEMWDLGALAVSRGAGSHGSDIIAVFPLVVKVIEAKVTHEFPPPLYVEERKKLSERANKLDSLNPVMFNFRVKIVGVGEVEFTYYPAHGYWGKWFVILNKNAKDGALEKVLEWENKICYGAN